mmetsp:Transcript_21971/g.33562  ORF Transcript_21971/g.33562 Transcript_21971/m.33562 type:complete len:465 (-) Transcript_21971:23-1417(-)
MPSTTSASNHNDNRNQNYSSIQDVAMVYSSDESAEGDHYYFENNSMHDDESTTLMVPFRIADAKSRYTPREDEEETLSPQDNTTEDVPSRFRLGHPARTLVVLTCMAFALAVGSSCLVLWVGGDTEAAADWIQNTWELGVKGVYAQRIADRSSIHAVSTTVRGNNVPILGSAHARYNATTVLTRISGNDDGDDTGCEATVMLIRHCEKGNLKSHCNYVGFERAAYLATLFGDRWPNPSKIYALETKRNHHQNLREIETVRFVALNAEVEIDEEYGTDQTKELADTIVKSIVQSGENNDPNTHDNNMCGKLVLVSWKHSDIPRLARHLGCGPLQGCPIDYRGSQFDQVWQIKYVYRNMHDFSKAMTTAMISAAHEEPEGGGRRQLARMKHPLQPQRQQQRWEVFGNVQYENFDPLAYSKQVGDYGKNHNGVDDASHHSTTPTSGSSSSSGSRIWNSPRSSFPLHQ